MTTRSIKDSNECAKTELDLFFVPPTNTSIESAGYSEYSPVTNIEDGPIEFNVAGTQDEYIHLNKTMLYLLVSIYVGEEKIKNESLVGPVNNLASSLFC